MSKKPDWNELIPELKDWSPSQSPEGLAAALGRYPLAIGYLSLFWPSFVEYDDMVLLGDDVNEAAVSRWLVSTKGNKQAVEAVLNHFHIVDVQHPGIWGEATEPQIKFIGQVLKEAWECKLARDFPKRQFTVELIEGASDSLRDYQVIFYQPALKPEAAQT